MCSHIYREAAGQRESVLQKPPTTHSHLSKPSESRRGKGQIVTSYAVGFPGAVYFLELLTRDFHAERFTDDMKFHLAGGGRTKEPWHAASGAAPIMCWHSAVGRRATEMVQSSATPSGPGQAYLASEPRVRRRTAFLPFTFNPWSSLTGITSST